MSTPTNLILICCHAIYLGGPTRGASEGEWLLAPFQTGETPTFTAHIKTGLSLLSSSPASLLLFSGATTKPQTQKSEAQSYLDLCVDNDFWGLFPSESGGRGRVGVEEKALDSLGNLVFGIIEFWRRVGKWPENVTVISHAFKRERFLDLHVKALRWPGDRVNFVGVDPDYMVEESGEFDKNMMEAVKRGEKQRGYDPWKHDLCGRGEVLRGKRRERDCWGTGGSLFESQEERMSSGVRTELLDFGNGDVQEVLKDERQPWERD